jgi:hypothetical protein
MPAADELEAAVLEVCHHNFLKVAMILWRAQDALQAKGIHADLDDIAQGIARLVTRGELEAAGDITGPRHSEIRLAASTER